MPLFTDGARRRGDPDRARRAPRRWRPRRLVGPLRARNDSGHRTCQRRSTRSAAAVQPLSAGEFRPPVQRDGAEASHKPLVEKTRHEVRHAGLLWHVDEFGGDNAGLLVAEVELAAADQAVQLPGWVGREVTEDPGYRNSELSRRPMRRRDGAGA